MKSLKNGIILCSLLLISATFLIGCGNRAKPEVGIQNQSFTLMTNFDVYSDDEINHVLLDEIISGFNPYVWDFLVLSPSNPIQDSIFIQVGAPTEIVDYQYTVEIGFRTYDEGVTLYRLYTSDKETALQYVVDYWKEQTIPDILAWEDVTWEFTRDD